MVNCFDAAHFMLPIRALQVAADPGTDTRNQNQQRTRPLQGVSSPPVAASAAKRSQGSSEKRARVFSHLVSALLGPKASGRHLVGLKTLSVPGSRV